MLHTSLRLNLTQLLGKLRVIGCIFIVCSHFTMIYVSITAGIIVHLIADVLTLPFFIKNKMWDMVVMLSFLVAIGLSKLFHYGT